MSGTEVSIIIADEISPVRSVLRRIAGRLPGFRILSEAADGHRALEAIDRFRPMIAVLNARLAGCDGLEIARIIAQRGWNVATLILARPGDGDLYRRAMRHGVKGYLSLDDVESELEHALCAISQGGWYINPSKAAPDTHEADIRTPVSVAEELRSLSPTERRVFDLVADCHSTRDIAALLSVSPRTVDHHRSNIARKLNLRGRYALVRYAMKLARDRRP